MQDFIEQTRPRTFALMLAAIVVLTIALPITYLLIPQIKSYRGNSQQFALLDQAVINSDSLDRQLATMEKDVKQLSRQLHGDMAQLPVKQMESYIIGRLQKVSWDNQIELVAVKPGQGKRVQNFRESLFDVKLVSGYHNFFKWLQMVNRELGYIVVNRFELAPRGNQPEQDPQLDINLTLVSYRVVANAQ